MHPGTTMSELEPRIERIIVPHPEPTRRGLLGLGGLAAATTLLACAGSNSPRSAESPAGEARGGEEHESEVTPGEDLMQEHGLIERLVIVYDAAALRIEQNQQLDLSVLVEGASIVRVFVEDYHEQNEENFVFPRLQAAGKHRELVNVLLRQHQRGRQLTDEIAERAKAGPSRELALSLRNFGHMYRAHAAREDTLIFPALRELMEREEYRTLGEQLEAREQQLLGKHGFEAAVSRVAGLEQRLGIADLDQFTPA